MSMAAPLRRAAAVAALWACAMPALAYIDPGTGSMLLQSALAAVAAVLVFGRSVWTKLKGFFIRGNRKAGDTDQ